MSGRIDVPASLYQRLIEEVRARQRWEQKHGVAPVRWSTEKGLIEIDRIEPDPDARFRHGTWATARVELRKEKLHNLSVDLQWGDGEGQTRRTNSWPFHDFLLGRRDEIESAVRAKTGKPGVFRVRKDTPRANWMMEAGYTHDHDVDLFDTARFEEYVDWFVQVVPVARNLLRVEVRRYVLEGKGR